MTRPAAETAAFLAAHAAPLPAHVTRESVAAMTAGFSRDAGRASAIAPNAQHESFHDSDGRAVFTVTRPRVLDREGLYTLALCDGRTVAAFARVPTVAGALKAVLDYLAKPLPDDCDPAAELDSYRASFRDNWEGDLSQSAYPTFKGHALTRAARWAFRIAAAEAEAKARAEGVESMASGPDWAGAEFGPFYAQEVARDGTRGRFAFGQTETEARAKLAALVAPARAQLAAEPTPLRIKLEGRRTLDQLEAEDAAAKAEARAARKSLDQLEAEAAAPVPVVDVTPTWGAVARIIELGLTHGNATGRQMAREELARMAAIADSAVAAAKAKANPGEAVDLARACLAAYPKTDKAFTGKGPACDAARDLRDALAGLLATL